MKKHLSNEEYLLNWPEKYYDIEDISLREELLKQKIAQESENESSDDNQRLQLLHKRFEDKKTKDGIRPDRFMRAFMTILISKNDSIGFWNQKRLEKELRKNLEEFGVLNYEYDKFLEAEWADFACTYIASCLESKTYSSTLFGMVHVKDSTVALKIADDIDQVTRVIPASFNLEEECKKLHEIMVTVYKNEIDGGIEYWNEYNNK